MSIETNKSLVQHYITEVINTGQIGLIDAYWVSEEAAAHVRRELSMLCQAFPDLHCVVEQQIAEGDAVVTRWSMAGTQSGPFYGISPTGRTAHWDGVAISRLAEGKFTEDWVLPDKLAIMQQLGAIPLPGASPLPPVPSNS